MINSYNSATQSVASGAAYVFDTNRIVTGCTVGHAAGTPTFTLTKPGYYYISFNTTFTTAETGEVTVELQNNGVAVPGANASETVAVVGDVGSMSFATIIKVLPSCCAIDNTANLTFVVTDTALSVTTANVNITKLC